MNAWVVDLRILEQLARETVCIAATVLAEEL
jgi:hypothetical protein